MASKRSYLFKSLASLVNKDALESVIEYLLSFDIFSESSKTDMQLYLVELCGNNKNREIRDVVNSYFEQFKLFENTVDDTSNPTQSNQIQELKKPKYDTYSKPVILPTKSSQYPKGLLNIDKIGVKKHGKKTFTSIKDIEAKVTGKVCGCMATRHKFIGNCTSCGRISCQIEGPITKAGISCFFCDGIVIPPMSADEILDNNILSSEDNYDNTMKAYQLKDKLLIFDKENAKRTHVHDSQADYYETSTWLTEDEIKEIDEKERLRFEKNKPTNRKIRIAYDIAGRLVQFHLFSMIL